jgi:hypothetical protein
LKNALLSRISQIHRRDIVAISVSKFALNWPFLRHRRRVFTGIILALLRQSNRLAFASIHAGTNRPHRDPRLPGGITRDQPGIKKPTIELECNGLPRLQTRRASASGLTLCQLGV